MEEIICKHCSKKFNSEESLDQHIKAKHKIGTEKTSVRKNTRKYVLLLIIIVSLAIFSYTLYVRAQRPGRYDEFAKCLTEKGVVVYGNDICPYTAKQLNWFDKSKKHLNYVKCANNKELCDSKGVKITPTWEVNGKMYEGIQGFEKLAELSGCKL